MPPQAQSTQPMHYVEKKGTPTTQQTTQNKPNTNQNPKNKPDL